MLFSNPFRNNAPDLGQPMYQHAETFGIRLRDTLTRPFFYHTNAAFAVSGSLLGLGIGASVLPWFMTSISIGAATTLTAVGAPVALLTGVGLVINAHIFGWADNDSEHEYHEFLNQSIVDENDEKVGIATLQFRHEVANNSKQIPYLSITTDSHYHCGFIQGYTLVKPTN